MVALTTRAPGVGRRHRPSQRMQGRWLTYLILIVATLISVFPFYWTIVAATHSNADINHVPPPLIPGGNLGHNIHQALQQADIGKALVNSLIVSSSIAAGTVVCCTLAGFAFAKLRFRGRNALLLVVIGTMLFPTQLGVIPLFMVMAKLHWVNQLQSVILPTLVTAFGVFLMRAISGRRTSYRTLGDRARRRRQHDTDFLEHRGAGRPPGDGGARPAHVHDGVERLLLAHRRPQLRQPHGSGRIELFGQRIRA